MSLINDALKRARLTQQQNPTSTPPLQLRPVEVATPNHARAPLLLVGLALLLIMVLALGGLIVWFVVQKSAGELRVTARPVTAPTARVPADSQVGLVPPAPAPAPSPPLPTSAELDTNALTAAVTVEPPPPPAPKLQGIAFHPSRPSAVVNGKTVVVGDRVAGFRVLAITRRSVTLGNEEATNVLSLSE